MNTAVIASLIGVALGAAGAIAAQYLAVRETNRQARLTRLSERLDYRRLLIREFLEEAQEAEERAIFHYQNGRPAADATSRRLWFLQKYLNLVIPELTQVTVEYAGRLDSLLWGGVPDQYRDVWDAMGEPRNKFLLAAGAVVDVDLRSAL